MERLTGAEERLDGPLDDRAVLVGNLRDLRRVNRYLGGVALSAYGLDRLADGRPELTLLDVGTGGADIPLALVRAWRRDGRRLRVVGLDSRPEVLAAAVEADPRLAEIDGLELRVGDGRALPYPDASFDVAHVSLVVHHLEPDGAVALLRELRRVARLGVVVNDLARGRLAWLGAWLLAYSLTRNPFTRHDAPMSVRRAYTLDEAADLLTAAGLQEIDRRRGLFGHRWTIVAIPGDVPETPP
jgi:ubiquinone/menaquinone biosynthesis C-methylase UbiE